MKESLPRLLKVDLSENMLESRVLYRDGLMLVIDKPAGIPVHAGPKGGPNLEQFLAPLRYGFPNNPGLAHRLDRDTSGCLVLGRHPKALRRLGKLFSNGLARKTYWAVVRGVPGEKEGIIDMPMRKKTDDPRSWWMVVDQENGQTAVTEYKVLGEGSGLSLVELHPLTGRTHQIRVHLSAIGTPILGDPVYGTKEDKLVPMHLHARSITLPLYPNKDPVTVTAEPPPHMVETLEACQLLKRSSLKMT